MTTHTAHSYFHIYISQSISIEFNSVKTPVTKFMVTKIEKNGKESLHLCIFICFNKNSNFTPPRICNIEIAKQIKELLPLVVGFSC